MLCVEIDDYNDDDEERKMVEVDEKKREIDVN